MFKTKYVSRVLCVLFIVNLLHFICNALYTKILTIFVRIFVIVLIDFNI